MKNYIAILIFLLLWFGTHAKADEIQIKTVETKGDNTSLKMPYVVFDNAAVAMRINDAIFLKVTGNAAPKAWQESYQLPADFPGVTGEFEVVQNDRKILSIKFNGTSCGSSCWPDEMYLNFDAKSGLPITLDDLLTSNATRQMKSTFEKELTIATKKWLVKNDGEKEWQKADLLYPIDGVRGFLIKNNKLSLFGKLDYKGYELYESVFDAAAQEQLLTHYGKYIFLDAAETRPEKNSAYGLLLEGNIGDASIKMMLEEPYCYGKQNKRECTVSGYYFYEKYRSAIEINGVLLGERRLAFREHINDKRLAKINLVMDGVTLAGKWTLDKKEHDVFVTSQ